MNACVNGPIAASQFLSYGNFALALSVSALRVINSPQDVPVLHGSNTETNSILAHPQHLT